MLALLVIIVILGASFAGGCKAKPKDLTLRLDWLLGSEHAPYYVAIEKGFFKEAGLNVTIREGEGSSVTVKLVGNGNDTFGIVGAGTVLLSVAEGIPVQSVATIFQNSPTAVIFPKDKPLKSLEDLRGKNLGVLIKSVTYPEWQALAKMKNLDIKAMKITEVGIDRAIVEPMLAKRIDAGIAWVINDGVQLQLKQETGFLKFSDLGINIPSSTLITNKATMEKDPKMVKAFTAAVLKGWKYTQDNPKEAFQIIMKYAPKIDPIFNETKLPMVIELAKSPKGIGYNDPVKWENLKKLYSEFGLLKIDLDITKVYTNNFMPTK
jgi:NitT/TauT family transport system substrate-binding protein